MFLLGGGPAGIFLSTMRHLTVYLALFALLLGAASASAQSAPPPPPPAPALDYFPDKWKEYVYEKDNVKFRLPAEPKVTSSSTNADFGTVMTRTYTHNSFIQFMAQVTEFPQFMNFEEGTTVKEMLDEARDEMLNLKQYEPKLIKESDVTVDGHPGRLFHFQSTKGEGTTLRVKIFYVRNRLYFVSTEVKTGEKHGHNFENDFEKVTMAFLDSIKLVAAVK